MRCGRPTVQTQCGHMALLHTVAMVKHFLAEEMDSTTSTSRSSYQSKTVAFKVRILNEIENGVKPSTIAKREGLARSTIATWLKNKEQIKLQCHEGAATSKRHKESSHHAIDKALKLWFTQTRSQNVPVDGNILLAKANKFAVEMGESEVSRGWIDRFKRRHGIGAQRIVGEAASVDTKSVDEQC